MTQDALHLVLVQDNPIVGDYDGNARIVIDKLNEHSTADLIAFPECFLSGYPLLDLVGRPSCIGGVAAQIERVRRAVMEAQGPAVLVGAPTAGATKPYNSAVLIEPCGNVRYVHKTELPNEDVFFERRTFASNESRKKMPLAFRGFALGVMICEDMWHEEVARGLAGEGADIFLVLNGSPYQRNKQATRLRHARSRISQSHIPLIYLNLVGGQDEIVFDGQSFIANTDGTIAEAPVFQSYDMKIVLRRDESGQVHIGLDEIHDGAGAPHDPVGEDYQACVLALRDYVEKTGQPHVFVGVSGGIDSAAVLAMAVDALGPDRVYGIMMPSPFTSQKSIDDAEDLMARLGVNSGQIDIKDMLEATLSSMSGIADAFGRIADRAPNHSLAEENFQSRLRGMCLMGLTNLLGGIVLTTGNKSEMAVGYATLYGDMGGGYNPLKSSYKTRVRAMCTWRNSATTVLGQPVAANPIPVDIITKPPSAELRDGQIDSDSLGDYEALDFVIHQIVELKADARTAATRLERHFGNELDQLIGGAEAGDYAERISRLIRISQHKRDQAPVGAKTNPTDFGAGWQYPIAGAYAL